jgi:hypothetical protein
VAFALKLFAIRYSTGEGQGDVRGETELPQLTPAQQAEEAQAFLREIDAHLKRMEDV